MSGNRVLEIRKNLGLTQKELGEKIGVTHTCVNYWENGKRKPSKMATILLNQLAEKKKSSMSR